MWAYNNYEKFGNALVKGLENCYEHIPKLTQEEKEELREKLGLVKIEKKLKENKNG